MDITLVVLVVGVAVALYLALDAAKDKRGKGIRRTTYLKLFLAGFVIGFAGMFWLIPNTYVVKTLFGIGIGTLAGISAMIRVPQGWRYTEKHAKQSESMDKRTTT